MEIDGGWLHLSICLYWTLYSMIDYVKLKAVILHFNCLVIIKSIAIFYNWFSLSKMTVLTPYFLVLPLYIYTIDKCLLSHVDFFLYKCFSPSRCKPLKDRQATRLFFFLEHRHRQGNCDHCNQVM